MQKEHFEVLLESIDSKLQLLLELICAFSKMINDVRDELKEDKGRIKCPV